MKRKQRGGKCTNWAYTGRSISPGQFERGNVSTDCQSGGKRKKKGSLKKLNKRSNKGKVSKKRSQKVDEIINELCKSLKKCTPKYKKVLKKIVLKNM
jgi:hypothetical protein